MGRLTNGINGSIIGKVGSVIGSSRNGNPYIKGPHKKRTKKVSEKELANRHKFSLAQAWLKPVVEFVREGFKNYAATSQGFVAAKSYLLRNAFEGVAPNISINPALVKLSVGELVLPQDIKVELIANESLRFSWNKNQMAHTGPDDQVMLMAYDIKRNLAFWTVTGQFRKTGEDFLQIDNTPGNAYHVYLAFSEANRKTQSDSVYLGEIKV